MGVSIFYKKGETGMKFNRGAVKKELKRYEVASDSSVPAAEEMDRVNEVLRGWKPYKAINTVTVRWHDGYMETFRATEVRFGSGLLWMRLEDGTNRHIPLRSVRWFGTSIESHQSTGF